MAGKIIAYAPLDPYLGDTDISTKQDKTDNGLTTTNKTVVGAINEVDAVNDTQATAIAALQASITTWTQKGTNTNARTLTYNLVSGKRYRVLVNWEGATTHTGGVEYYFLYAGTPMIITHFQSNVGVLTLLAEVLELKATATAITITVFQTGNITGNGRIVKLEEAS